jgi:hypothetical protein
MGAKSRSSQCYRVEPQQERVPRRTREFGRHPGAQPSAATFNQLFVANTLRALQIAPQVQPSWL